MGERRGPTSVWISAAVGGVLLGLAPGPAPQSWAWDVPPGIPEPRVPADNPMSTAKVELGRHLFYDTRLSGNETQSCASCHRQELAFTDGLARAEGSTGEVHPRGSMSLANIAYASTLTWADPEQRSLEDQQRGPLFGTEPVELGMSGREDELLARLEDASVYPEMFAAAFPSDEDPFTVDRVLDAIAAFERTLISFDAPYDRYMLHGDRAAVDRDVLLGAELYFSDRMGCAQCHDAPFYTSAVTHVDRDRPAEEFFNTGLYDVDGQGAYPAPNTGVQASTGDPADMGRFRAPTLRNIAVTAPYMHDGSIETLDDVLVEHYMPGGRTDNPLKSYHMVRFGLTPYERSAVVAFLESLTDSTFLTDPRFSDPWEGRNER